GFTAEAPRRRDCAEKLEERGERAEIAEWFHRWVAGFASGSEGRTGRSLRLRTFLGFRERSQLGDGVGSARAVQESIERLVLFAFDGLASVQQLAMGTVPGALQSDDLTLDAGEQFGGGRSAQKRGHEVRSAGFGEDGAIRVRIQCAPDGPSA